MITKKHVLIGFANPYLVCEECKQRVPYWHDPGRCGCVDDIYNSPCEHRTGVLSTCPSWDLVEGCNCDNKDGHVSK